MQNLHDHLSILYVYNKCFGLELEKKGTLNNKIIIKFPQYEAKNYKTSFFKIVYVDIDKQVSLSTALVVTETQTDKINKRNVFSFRKKLASESSCIITGRSKTLTANCRPSVKCRLSLQTGCKMQTEYKVCERVNIE